MTGILKLTLWLILIIAAFYIANEVVETLWRDKNKGGRHDN